MTQSSQLSTPLPTSSAASKTQTTQSTNICSPTIVLASPTALVGSIDGSSVSVDDRNYQLNLPFDMQIFDRASPNVFVSTNGVSPFHPTLKYPLEISEKPSPPY